MLWNKCLIVLLVTCHLLVRIDKGSNASLLRKASFAPFKDAAKRRNCVILLKHTPSLLTPGSCDNQNDISGITNAKSMQARRQKLLEEGRH